MQISEDSKFITSKQRISIDIKQRQLYVESYKKSGLTMTAFCNENNLALSSFSKWLNRKTKKLTTFKPLSLSASPTPVNQSFRGECIELQFEGKGKLTFSNIKNPELIIAVVRGLLK
jgi:hypothetical protein